MSDFLKSIYKNILYLLLLVFVKISRWALKETKNKSNSTDVKTPIFGVKMASEITQTCDCSDLKTPQCSIEMTPETTNSDCSDLMTPPKCVAKMTPETKNSNCFDLMTPKRGAQITPETKQIKDWSNIKTPPNNSFKITPLMRSHRPGSSSRIITSMKRLSQRKATPYPYHISRVLFDAEDFMCSTPKRTDSIARSIFHETDGFDNYHFTPIKM